MAFSPPTYFEILQNMLDYVASNSTIDDDNVGAVIRTVLEACAIEDDEQYYQMVQILDMFSIASATRGNLDRRLADFGLSRNPASFATTRGRFVNEDARMSTLDADISAGTTSVGLFSTAEFPTTYPYVVRLGEGTSSVENVTVSNNNTTTNTLTLSAGTLYDHDAADYAVLVTGSTGITINLGTKVEVPATSFQSSIVFSVVTPAYIAPGNYMSNEVSFKAVEAGSRSTIGPGQITRFQGSPPAPGLRVFNTLQATGYDEERDEDFRQRAFAKIQSLSRGTPLALKSAAVGVLDSATGQQIKSASVVEDFDLNEVFVYVDDGTGLVPETVANPSTSISAAAVIGDLFVTVADASAFPTVGSLIIEAEGVNDTEYVTYVKVSPTILNVDIALVDNHGIGAIVRGVEQITQSAESGQRRFRLNNSPVVRNSERIYWYASSTWNLLDSETDYTLNRGTGEFKVTISGGIPLGSRVVASYDYYSNIMSEVSKVLEGDKDDPITYPGVKAAGIFLSVEAPVIRRVSVVVSIVASPGFREADLYANVRRSIETYIRSLGIGGNVIRSKIVDVVHNVRGIADVQVISPINNLAVLENEIAIPTDSLGNSLVTVI